MSTRGTRGPLRLFLDANILVSGLVFGGPEEELLRAAEQGRMVAVTSAYIMAQVRRTLLTKLSLSQQAVETALAMLPVELSRAPSQRSTARAAALLRDPSDGPVLAAAWEAKADALVTGDKDFLHAGSSLGIPILRTRDALSLLGAGADVP